VTSSTRHIVGASLRAAAVFAPLPCPGNRMAESRKWVNTIINEGAQRHEDMRLPRANFREQIVRERTPNFSSHGNSATKSAAIARQEYQWLARWAACRSMCSTVRRRRPRHSCEARCSLPGIDIEPGNAEITVSRVPFRSSPIDAPRNSLNSYRMSSDNAAWSCRYPVL